MPFIVGQNYFIATTHAFLRESPDAKSKALNHLILGDWTQCKAAEDQGWVKVYSRRQTGFVRTTELTSRRALEINFLDIGQGDSAHVVTPDDEIFVIDGGMTDNLHRFLSWRYNLRSRKVVGVAGVAPGDPAAQPPMRIDWVIVSHPDKDHYYGLGRVFGNPKIEVRRVLHNGIFERKVTASELATAESAGAKWFEDLGRTFRATDGTLYLRDLVRDHAAMTGVMDAQQTLASVKDYYETFKALRDNPASQACQCAMVSHADGHLPGFEPGKPLEIEVLGPVVETMVVDGAPQSVLRKLGDKGETKNGHSVVLRLTIGKLRVLLGGDLNTKSEDYLLRHYTGLPETASALEKTIYQLERKGTNRTPADETKLTAARAARDHLVQKGRERFEVDVAKACHHGSHHFSETFLKVLNPIAVVISSGDEESYGHPRPDALGAFGKCGRGHRPLIFSTEVARSTREFTPLREYFEKIRAFEAEIAAAPTAAEKARLQKEMEEAKDSNVARYGMITLRSDGVTTIIASKLEVPSKEFRWDIHELAFNAATGQMEYLDKTKH
jgi:beta-lactamase superfamily II metal-dependent hydrolase